MRKDGSEGFSKHIIITVIICTMIIAAMLYCQKDGKWQGWFSGHSKETFHKGRSLVTQGHYRQAIPLLLEYLDKYPQGQNASRSIFFIGKAYLGLGDMKRAKQAFNDTHRMFPESLEAHKAHYKLALIDMMTGYMDQAIHGFASMAQRPDGPLAPEATAMSAYLTHQSNISWDSGLKQEQAKP
jgi:TolA-binding protein